MFFYFERIFATDILHVSMKPIKLDFFFINKQNLKLNSFFLHPFFFNGLQNKKKIRYVTSKNSAKLPDGIFTYRREVKISLKDKVKVLLENRKKTEDSNELLKNTDLICYRCGVFKKTGSRRRYQIGYIHLFLHCSHIWHFKTRPFVFSILLDVPPLLIHQIVYFQRILTSRPNYCIARGDFWKYEGLTQAYGYLAGQYGYFDDPAPWNKSKILFEVSLNDFGSLALFRVLQYIDIEDELKQIESLLSPTIQGRAQGSFENTSFQLKRHIGNLYCPSPLPEKKFVEWVKRSNPFFALKKQNLQIRVFESDLPFKKKVEPTIFYTIKKNDQSSAITYKIERPLQELSAIQDLRAKPKAGDYLPRRRYLSFPFQSDFFSLKKYKKEMKSARLRGLIPNILRDWIFLYDKKRRKKDPYIFHSDRVTKFFAKSFSTFLQNNFKKRKIADESKFNVKKNELKRPNEQKLKILSYIPKFYLLLGNWITFYQKVRFSYRIDWKIQQLVRKKSERKDRAFDSKIFFYRDFLEIRFRWARYQNFSKRRLNYPVTAAHKAYLFQGIWTEHQYRLFRRYKMLQRLALQKLSPKDLILRYVPVLPPTLRPLIQMSDGLMVSSDLNEFYLYLVRRQNRLAMLLSYTDSIPIQIVVGEYTLIQATVDVLLENGRVASVERKSYPISRPLKSLTDFIQGKEGRFRHNLLGKRVDYSARSVIVVGPKLRLSQCGLPREIALKLFYPFIVKFLLHTKKANSVFSAKLFLYKYLQLSKKKKFFFNSNQNSGNTKVIPNVLPLSFFTLTSENENHEQSNVFPFIDVLTEDGDIHKEASLHSFWNLIQKIIGKHPILLNRAPTLHRLGIQAFFPVLIPGRAIQLHPLVCPAFNADFDGDQMGIHLPLSIQAQLEARLLMLSFHHWFSPATGQPAVLPSQDMVLGFYYLTAGYDHKTPYCFFQNIDAVMYAYQLGSLHVHTSLWLKWDTEYEIGEKEEDIEEIFLERSGESRHLTLSTLWHQNSYGEKSIQYIRTTVGRIIFNQVFID